MKYNYSCVPKISLMIIGLFFCHGVIGVKANQAVSDLQKRANLLDTYFYKATQGKDQIKYCKLFFKAFPSSFSEFESLYGYREGPAPLYFKGLEHILELFNHLQCIQEKEYYSKIIGIAIGGHWEADSVNYFQEGLHDRVLSKPELAFSILDSLSDEKIESFFYFFFHGIHPRWESIPKELVQATKSKRINELMEQGFKRAIADSGH